METADVRVQLENCLRSLAILREQNRRLQRDNEELRDLCCFLDDDRQKGRRLAREWQKFGRYTAKVMKQEVVSYQQKLQQLDGRQRELLRDNGELKDLCLYLDEERNGGANAIACPDCGLLFERPASRANSVVIRDSSKIRSGGGGGNGPNSLESSSSGLNTSSSSCSMSSMPERDNGGGGDNSSQSSPTYDSNNNSKQQQGKVSSVLHPKVRPPSEEDPPTRAIDVFTVYEEANSEALKDFATERAIIQEMCNVVWRSLATT